MSSTPTARNVAMTGVYTAEDGGGRGGPARGTTIGNLARAAKPLARPAWRRPAHPGRLGE
ncbi:hypothetical protein GCM10023321_82510 [Pseudonocardia eucalypti]|uniref:Uncharacterized protein n=1 Tax=Pseudonocardia eucalypti TaxID=648755 RepID=A0ABP9REL0_9PSEU